MGCGESTANSGSGDVIEELPESGAIVRERDGTLGGLPNNFTKKDLASARQQGSIDAMYKQLSQIAIDLKKKPTLPAKMEKACFLCCNTYTKPAYVLGVGPMNDTYTVAVNHKKLGYQVYFLHNPTPQEFLDFIPKFLKQTTKNLTIFFTGHGANVKDKDGDESDGQDEAFVFDTGHIVDDKLVSQLTQANGKTKVVLLTDCCHSGSIWDLQSATKKGIKIPANIVSLSAAKDSQTAKQTTMKAKDQGIFTYFFWKIFNETPNATIKAMEPKVNAGIQRFKQVFTVASTSNNMLTEPLFK